MSTHGRPGLAWLHGLDDAAALAARSRLAEVGIEVTTVEPTRPPDVIAVPWEDHERARVLLDAGEWPDAPPPAWVWVVPVAQHGSASSHDAEPLAEIVLAPYRPEDLTVAVRRALQRREHHLRADVRHVRGTGDDAEGLIGPSAALQGVIASARQVAESPGTSILLQGDSGTGKELIARLIHGCSAGRRRRPFVDLNCAAIPSDLLEAELFGYERGAFTEAIREKAGLIELADGGTLFLDEIGELNIGLQAKLLRALETRSFRRLGSVANRRSECRVIASTNRDLLDAVQRGFFRLDLYHRLAVMTIVIPPLRQRPADIVPLAEHFLRHFATATKKRLSGFSPAALALLRGYPYPGNVRELRNIIERAVILEKGPVITPKSLGLDVSTLPDAALVEATAAGGAPELAVTAMFASGVPGDPGQSLEDRERHHIRAVLEKVRGNRTAAARILRISAPTLYKKIRKYGFETVGRDAVDDPPVHSRWRQQT